MGWHRNRQEDSKPITTRDVDMQVIVNGIGPSVLDGHLWAFLGLKFTNQAHEVFNNVPSMHGLEVWRRLIEELFPLTDFMQMDLQTGVYAPAGATTPQRIRSAIGNSETSVAKFNRAGGSIHDTSKKNILLKIVLGVVADPRIMTLQNYPTYAALKQHAMCKADLLMNF